MIISRQRNALPPIVRVATIIVGIMILMAGGRFIVVPLSTSGQTSMPPPPLGPNDPCRVADGALVIADVVNIVSGYGGAISMNARGSQTIIRNIAGEIWIAHADFSGHLVNPIRSGKMSITKFLSIAENMTGSWAPGKIARMLGFRADALVQPTMHSSLEEMHDAMHWDGQKCGQ